MGKKQSSQLHNATHEVESHFRAGATDVKRQLVGDNFFRDLLGLGGDSSSNEKAGIPPSEITPQNDGLREIFDFKKYAAGRLDKITISQEKQSFEKSRRPEIKAAIDYRAEILQTNTAKQESREIEYQIRQIKEALRQLISTSKILQMQFAEIAIDQEPTNIGKYHLTLLEFISSLIQAALKNTEDAGAWIQATGNKNAKRASKKLRNMGEKVTQSNERAISTSVG